MTDVEAWLQAQTLIECAMGARITQSQCQNQQRYALRKPDERIVCYECSRSDLKRPTKGKCQVCGVKVRYKYCPKHASHATMRIPFGQAK